MVDPSKHFDCGPVEYNPDDEMSSDLPTELVDFQAVPGVTGTGVGKDEAGDDCYIVYVCDVSVEDQIPKSILGKKVIAVVTGQIDALA